MVDKLWHKAKAFIGLADEGDFQEEQTIQRKEEGINLDLGQMRFKSNKKPSNGDLEINIYEPRAYDDSLGISATLRSGNPVVINLKYLDSSEGMRLIDFVCGTAYAIDGHMMKISDTIFLLSPNSIAISDSAGEAQSESDATSEGLLHNRM